MIVRDRENHVIVSYMTRGNCTWRVSRRNFLLLGGLSTTALVTDGWAPVSAQTAAQVALNFEGGVFGYPITGHKGASIASEYACSGSFGCRLDPTTNGGLASITVDSAGFTLGMPWAVFSMWFRLLSTPAASDSYMNLLEIGNTSTLSGKSQFTVFFQNNRLVCDLAAGERMDLAPAPTDGAWHQIQAVIYVGGTTYSAQVSYDGAAAKTLTSANNKQAASIKVLWVHYPKTVVDYSMDLDDVLMSTSVTEPEFFFPPPPPAPVAVIPFSESFQGGVVGSKPTAATTSYDQVIGDTGAGTSNMAVLFDAAGFSDQCVRFFNTMVAAPTYGFLGEQVGRQPIICFRRYYKVDVLPTQRTSVLLYKWGGTGNGQLGGTHNGSFALGGNAQSHRFVLVNKDTVATTSQATVPLNQYFRVETKLDFTSGTGMQTARLFLGSNVSGLDPDETLTAGLAGTYTDYVEDGILTNPGVLVNVFVDDAVNAADWVGP
jgi:hypothetical protein